MNPHFSGGSEVISALVSPSRMSNGTGIAVEPFEAAGSAMLASGTVLCRRKSYVGVTTFECWLRAHASL
jgi:hypothetical protein